MNDVHYRLNFEGVSALVMNSNAALLNGREQKGHDPTQYEREHFREKAYADSAGNLVIPGRCIKKTAINACKYYPKKPKGTSFRSFGPLVEAALLIPADATLGLTLDDLQPATMVVNLDPSKGPRGPRGPRTRPAVPVPWKATADIVVFDPALELGDLQAIFERAGKLVGLLDARSIDFGRCLIRVTEI